MRDNSVHSSRELKREKNFSVVKWLAKQLKVKYFENTLNKIFYITIDIAAELVSACIGCRIYEKPNSMFPSLQ